jgi:RNA polymerase sigma factor (sigma-70 family)
MESDLVLLERWQAGDRSAGEDLFGRHFADVYRFFRHKVGDAAGDLAQQTFLSCVKSAGSFRRQSSFRTFLFAIARNELYSHLRRLPRQGGDLDFDVTSIAEVVTSLGTRLDRAQGAERLRAALLQLPAEQQLMLELHYWHDLDAAQLAEVFDSTPGSMRVRLLRARRALRDRLLHLFPDGAIGPSDDRLAASVSEPVPDDE